MNLPNKLTMLRILLIPVFMVVLYWDFPGATWVAVAIFIVASFTDLLDGKIARKYNLVTDFGKFADRRAVKLGNTLLGGHAVVRGDRPDACLGAADRPCPGVCRQRPADDRQ